MRNQKFKTILLSTVAAFAVAVAATSIGTVAAKDGNDNDNNDKNKGKNPTVTATVNGLNTKTPIKHLVVIFNENISFDHYFGTYPSQLDVEGEPVVKIAKNTQTDINTLLSNPSLLTNNPNLNAANAPGNVNPFRLDRSQFDTADQGHGYTAEQSAYDNGNVDLFPKFTGSGTTNGAGAFGTKGQVMGYFDGATVTAMWNYAQNFAMSDTAFGDQFGPSTPGAINMFAGNTNGFTQTVGTGSSNLLNDTQGGFTLIGDIDPSGDVCSSPTTQAMSKAANIGDLLNTANIPWGSFVGGFDLTVRNINGTTGCARSSISPATGRTQPDYNPHHEWFQYFASTANSQHLAPSSLASVGLTNVAGKTTKDPANHAYDLALFEQAVGQGNFPAVSFIKQIEVQDAHPGNSNPIDEQAGLVHLINFLQQQPDWDSTAVIIAYDDSDGWYDHVLAKTTQASFSPADTLNGAGVCGVGVNEPNGLKGLPVTGRCGPGTRQPFMVISPYAKKNYVSHVQITQASIPRFIEDNWLKGERLGGGAFDATTGAIDDLFNFGKKNSVTLILDETTGTVVDTTKNKN
jgi:phospholipase C